MIAVVKQSDKCIWVYDEHGRILFSRNGELVGYTQETVSVKDSTGTVWTYDKTGQILFGR